MAMFSKLNQIKELRSQAKQMQHTLASESTVGEYKGVRLTMDGNQTLTAVSVDSELLSPSRKDELEKNIIKAHEETIKKVHKIMAKKIKDSGYSLPSLK